MKTDTLKKSLLDYAIKGKLTARFRRENNGLNAFDEINTYNEAIKEKRKNLEKELKKCEEELKLEKDKDKKALFKSQIQMLKKELTKCKEITPLFCQESRFFANAQNDKKACHTDSTCHTDLERSEREVSNNTESQLVILSECEKSNTESKRDFSFATQTQNAVSLENDKKACHTDLECSEREVSKNTESQLVILSECEKSTKELKQILNSLSITLWSYLYENSYDTCYDGLGTCVAPIKDYE